MSRSPRVHHSVTPVDDVLTDTDNALGGLVRHARSLLRVESLLAGHFGPEAASQFQVAALRQDRLILLTPTASWASRLRLMVPQAIDFLNSSGYPQVRYIDFRVAPLKRESVTPRQRKSLSPAARQALDAMARLVNKTDT